jgi:hypothetical protein
VGCDSTVAISWCGPFRAAADGGVDYAGGLFVSADETVIEVGTWRGELFFAAPQIADPRQIPLERVVGMVTIPAVVGGGRTFATGLGRTSVRGTVTPPDQCFGTPIRSTRRVQIGARWKYFWRPSGRSDWFYCGTIDR